VKLLFQTVTRLWDRSRRGWTRRGIVRETGENVKRGVRAWPTTTS